MFHFSSEYFLKKQSVPVVLIQGDADEVLDFVESQSLVQQARKLGLQWRMVVEPNTGHVPTTFDRTYDRQLHILEAIDGLFDNMLQT
jgi:dipeptidyl aminopeptidase/acylaminoacyl peptidase